MHCLLIDPFPFPASSFNELLTQDLELHWRLSESDDAEFPSTDTNICKSVGEDPDGC